MTEISQFHLAQYQARLAASDPQQFDAMQETAQDFESMFVSQMMQPMFEGLETAPPFGGGYAEEMYRGMMIDAIAQEIAKNGGIGVGDMVMAEMIRMQENLQNTNAPASQLAQPYGQPHLSNTDQGGGEEMGAIPSVIEAE